MRNSVSGECSTLGSLSWATEQCTIHPNCEFIHDYDCNDKPWATKDNQWRFCLNLTVEEKGISSDSWAPACSMKKLARGETLVENHKTSKRLIKYWSSYSVFKKSALF